MDINDPTAYLQRENTEQSPPATCGHQLRVARERRNINVQQVAHDLRLTVNTVKALENDDYTQLPSTVFVTGYIKSYARLLGIDPQPLIANYRAAQHQPAAESAQPIKRNNQPGDKTVRLALVVLALVVTVAIALLWNPDLSLLFSAAQNESATEPTAMMPPDHPSNIDPQPTAELTENIEPDPPQQPSLLMPEQPSTTTPEPEIEPVPELPIAMPQPEPTPEPPAEPVPAEVVMEFSGPCWVDIRDTTGNFKLFGEMSKGDRHVLGGEPPYSMILGNASAVTITVGTATFDVQSQARGNVARFDLDPQDYLRGLN